MPSPMSVRGRMQAKSHVISLVSLGPFTLAGSPAYSQATSAGNLAVAWISSNGTISVIGSGWTAAVTASPNMMIFYKQNISAGENPPVFNTTGSEIYTQLAEFAGVAKIGALDQSTTNGGTSPQSITNTATDAAGGELIVYGAFWNGTNSGGAVSNTTISDGNGGSVTPTVTSGVQQSNQYYCYMFGIAGSGTPSQADVASASLNVFSGGACCIASFKH